MDPLTLPEGYTITFDTDGLDTPGTVDVLLDPGIDVAGIVFGYIGPGSISGAVWQDDNSNGVQDAGEAGLTGISVALLDATGAALGSLTTDGSGNYAFEGLPPGAYAVAVDPLTLPEGYTQTFDADGLGTPDRVDVLVDPGLDVVAVSFGYRDPFAALLITPNGGEVWQIDVRESILWDASLIPTDRVRIELSRDGGQTWETIKGNTRNDGRARWRVRGATTSNALLRITDRGGLGITDVSDAPFSIQ